MLQFQGTERFVEPLAQVWSKLSDARFLIRCVPGVESQSKAESDHAECVLHPGFSFVRGTLQLSLQVLDRIPERSLRLLLHSKGIGSSSEVQCQLTLAEEGTGTRVDWTANIQSLGGLLKAIPQGLIKASAQKVIGDALAALRTQLST